MAMRARRGGLSPRTVRARFPGCSGMGHGRCTTASGRMRDNDRSSEEEGEIRAEEDAGVAIETEEEEKKNSAVEMGVGMEVAVAVAVAVAVDEVEATHVPPRQEGEATDAEQVSSPPLLLHEHAQFWTNEETLVLRSMIKNADAMFAQPMREWQHLFAARVQERFPQLKAPPRGPSAIHRMWRWQMASLSDASHRSASSAPRQQVGMEAAVLGVASRSDRALRPRPRPTPSPVKGRGVVPWSVREKDLIERMVENGELPLDGSCWATRWEQKWRIVYPDDAFVVRPHKAVQSARYRYTKSILRAAAPLERKDSVVSSCALLRGSDDRALDTNSTALSSDSETSWHEQAERGMLLQTVVRLEQQLDDLRQDLGHSLTEQRALQMEHARTLGRLCELERMLGTSPSSDADPPVPAFVRDIHVGISALHALPRALVTLSSEMKAAAMRAHDDCVVARFLNLVGTLQRQLTPYTIVAERHNGEGTTYTQEGLGVLHSLPEHQEMPHASYKELMSVGHHDHDEYTSK